MKTYAKQAMHLQRERFASGVAAQHDALALAGGAEQRRQKVLLSCKRGV